MNFLQEQYFEVLSKYRDMLQEEIGTSIDSTKNRMREALKEKINDLIIKNCFDNPKDVKNVIEKMKKHVAIDEQVIAGKKKNIKALNI